MQKISKIKNYFYDDFKTMFISNIDLIAIDNMYELEYKEALYKAQKTDDITDLVNVFKLCQERLDGKMKEYDNFLKQIKSEIND